MGSFYGANRRANRSKISAQVVRNALDDLTGLHDYYEEYLAALEEWLEKTEQTELT